MADDAEIERRFWAELRSSPFMMLGLDGVEDGRSQPMTAFFDDGRAPIWFFTSTDSSLADHIARNSGRHYAIASFTSKGHDLFASLHGVLALESDPTVVERFWNTQVGAWYDGGRDDPKLVMLRLDADQARIWLSASSFAVPIRRLFGQNPREVYADRIAEVLL